MGIAPTTRSQRLKRLDVGGLIERKIYNDHPSRSEYLLTEVGESLGPVMLALGALR